MSDEPLSQVKVSELQGKVAPFEWLISFAGVVAVALCARNATAVTIRPFTNVFMVAPFSWILGYQPISGHTSWTDVEKIPGFMKLSEEYKSGP
jgi:hypothetical protein